MVEADIPGSMTDPPREGGNHPLLTFFDYPKSALVTPLVQRGKDRLRGRTRGQVIAKAKMPSRAPWLCPEEDAPEEKELASKFLFQPQNR